MSHLARLRALSTRPRLRAPLKLATSPPVPVCRHQASSTQRKPPAQPLRNTPPLAQASLHQHPRALSMKRPPSAQPLPTILAQARGLQAPHQAPPPTLSTPQRQPVPLLLQLQVRQLYTHKKYQHDRLFFFECHRIYNGHKRSQHHTDCHNDTHAYLHQYTDEHTHQLNHNDGCFLCFANMPRIRRPNL